MLIKYKVKWDILLMGDLNAWTGNEDSPHEKLGKQLGQLLPDTEATTLESSIRCSCHVKINTFGRKLVT